MTEPTDTTAESHHSGWWSGVALVAGGLAMIALGVCLTVLALPEANTSAGNSVGLLAAGLVLGGLALISVVLLGR